MVSIQDMANSYIEQLKFRIGQTEDQLVELQQHLQECENEVQFGKAGRPPAATAPSQEPYLRSLAEETSEECCKSEWAAEKSETESCCKSETDNKEVLTKPLSFSQTNKPDHQ